MGEHGRGERERREGGRRGTDREKRKEKNNDRNAYTQIGPIPISKPHYTIKRLYRYSEVSVRAMYGVGNIIVRKFLGMCDIETENSTFRPYSFSA